MPRPPVHLRRFCCALLIASSCTCPGVAQPFDASLADAPISEIRIEGLNRVREQVVRNELLSSVGGPLDQETIETELQKLERRGLFKTISVRAVRLDDGSVALLYVFEEEPIIAQVQTIGNKLISDQELRDAIGLYSGASISDFQIQDAVRKIQSLYRDKGYYLVSVSHDEDELKETGILLLEIIEGPRVRIKSIEFSGNAAYQDRLLHAQITTRGYIPLIRKGQLDEDKLAADSAALSRFYRDRGYLDIQADYYVDLSPDNREAKVVFEIIEGRQYTVRSIKTDPENPEVYNADQIAALIDLKPGDVFSQDKIRKSVEQLRAAYHQLGYIDFRMTGAQMREHRVNEEPIVDVVVHLLHAPPDGSRQPIRGEGETYRIGAIHIHGNDLTRDRVIRNYLRGLQPGRVFDGTKRADAERKINDSRLFGDVRITPQRPDEFGYRDIVVEVKETNTGSFSFGVAAGSDTGIFGDISLTQDNFDVTDWPESLGEFATGRAFRGGGQKFSVSLQPGDELSQYSIRLTEPNIFNTDNSLTVGGFLRQRDFNAFDEERFNFGLSSARRLGDIWSVGASTRVDHVELSKIAPDAPTEFFEDAGPDTLTGLGLSLTRSTISTIQRPGRGSRLELGVEQIGAFGGDFTFTTLEADYTVFMTLYEDFLGRKSILKLNSNIGYIIEDDEAPIYERYYLGGRSFRGFDFREVSPKGIRNDTGGPSDEPVGGAWKFFLGAQYEVPILEENITGVAFVDSGTVTDDPGLDDYRVSVGLGVRLYIPQFGPVPIAFDFGFPLLKEPQDDTRLFSFSAELPF